MKGIILLLLVCIGVGVYSQSKINNDNIDLQFARVIKMVNVSPELRPLVILDGVPYSDTLTDFKSTDIKSIQILDETSAKTIYASEGKNGAILITTKQYIIDSYQADLVFLSKSYRKFTREHDNDTLIKYRLNGSLLKGDKYAIADKLFNIPRETIKWIRVKKYYTEKGDAAIVSIRTTTTKK